MADSFLNKAGFERAWNKIKALFDSKQDTLISGTNIKTINNTSLLGSGNIDVSGGDAESDVFIFTAQVTTYQELVDAINAKKILCDGGIGSNAGGFRVFSGTYDASSVELSAPYGPGRDLVYTITGDNKWTTGVWDVRYIGENAMSDTSYYPVQNKVIKSYVDTAINQKQSQINNLQFQIDGLGEPFRLLDFTQTFAAGLTIPSCNQNLANTAIANVDVDLNVIDSTGALNRDFAVAGLLKYECYDATSGGNRLNCWPVTTFSMSGQQILRIRMMCGGTSSQTMKRIQGSVLLKHR